MASIPLQDGAALRTLAALYARYGRWLPAAVSAALVVLIAVLAARLVWALVPAPSSAAWKPAPAPPAARASQALDLNVITSAQLFGHYEPPANPAAAALASAPDTQLNLTLLGIFADRRNPRDSRALIAASGGEEKPYAVGDDISRGVSLHAIFADRVVLSRNGRLETLRLDKDQPGSGYVPPPDLPAPPTTEAGNPAALGQIRNQMLSDPSKAQDYIRVQPVQAGGGTGLHGYRIYPGRDRSLFTNSGLRPGDVVTSINGVELNDPAKSLQLLSDLSQASQISLTIDRGGQTQAVNVSLTP